MGKLSNKGGGFNFPAMWHPHQSHDTREQLTVKLLTILKIPLMPHMHEHTQINHGNVNIYAQLCKHSKLCVCAFILEWHVTKHSRCIRTLKASLGSLPMTPGPFIGVLVKNSCSITCSRARI